MLDAYWRQTGESKEMRTRTHNYMRRYWSKMLAAAPPAPGVDVNIWEATNAVIEELHDRGMYDGIDDDLIDELDAAIEGRIRSALVSPPATSPERESKAAAFDALRELAGHVQDGSHETLRVAQDDATKDWIVHVGKRRFLGSSLVSAIEAAMAGGA
jgi:hypothetical protein